MSSEEKSALVRFFSLPAVGIASTLSSLISIPLTFFFYHVSISQPDLTAFTNPARTTVVSASQTSSLTVRHNDKPVTGDLNAVQVALWNAGSKAIKRDDILSTIKIEATSKAPILEATIRSTSRPEIEFLIDDSQKDLGIISVSWKILEQNDGASIQLIYAGTDKEKFAITGSIVDQREINERRYEHPIKSPKEQFEANTGGKSYLNFVIGFAIIQLLLISLMYWIKKWEFKKFDLLLVFPAPVISLIIAIWKIFQNTEIGPPPFGF